MDVCVCFQDGKYVGEKDSDGLGLCPYDPAHNSTAVFAGEYIFVTKFIYPRRGSSSSPPPSPPQIKPLPFDLSELRPFFLLFTPFSFLFFFYSTLLYSTRRRRRVKFFGEKQFSLLAAA